MDKLHLLMLPILGPRSVTLYSEVNIHLASQEIFRRYGIRRYVRYYFHKSPPLDPIGSLSAITEDIRHDSFYFLKYMFAFHSQKILFTSVSFLTKLPQCSTALQLPWEPNDVTDALSMAVTTSPKMSCPLPCTAWP